MKEIVTKILRKKEAQQIKQEDLVRVVVSVAVSKGKIMTWTQAEKLINEVQSEINSGGSK